MNVDQLRELQAPIKSRYRDEPEAAVITLRAKGEIGQENLACRVETGRALVEAGLHPATGRLAACRPARATCCWRRWPPAPASPSRRWRRPSASRSARARSSVEGDLDFRGTLGVAKDAPVGFRAIRLAFALDTDAGEEQLASLLKLTERYCVVLQTLRVPAEFQRHPGARRLSSGRGVRPAPGRRAAVCSSTKTWA